MSLQAASPGQVLTVAAGAASGVSSGDYTLALLMRRPAGAGNTCALICYKPSNFANRGLFIADNDLYPAGVAAGGMANANLATDAWFWLVVTKVATPSAVRYHWATYTNAGALAWTHLDGDATGGPQGDDGPDIDRLCLGDPFGVGFQGDVAVVAAWAELLDDAAVEATFLRDAGLIHAAAPGVLAVFPEATAGTPVPDLEGGPGETARTGGWVTSADPPAFTFGLGPANTPPTVSAGADQQTETGEQVTLHAVGQDTDGTVASYVWTQVSGPAVALTGAGSDRTFTPGSAGVRVFSVQAFDDAGAPSAADTVTVTTTDPVVVVPTTPGSSLLDDADMAYMRETQAGARPTAANHYPFSDKVPDGMGGHVTGWPALDDGAPVQVRIVRVNDNTSSDNTPRDLAARFGATDLLKVVVDLVEVKAGDLLHDLDRDRWYELVSDAETQEWTTAHIVWAVRTDKRARP